MIRLKTMTKICLSLLVLKVLLTGPAHADFPSFPVLRAPGLGDEDPDTNTGCLPDKVAQDYIDEAYDAYRDHHYNETETALSMALGCASLNGVQNSGLDPNEIDDYRIAFSAAGSDPNDWPPFPFAVTQIPVAGSSDSSNSNDVLPAIVGALGGVLESAIQNSDNQNPGNQPAQPASQAPPSVASSTANDQSQQASSILAQWGLQQVPCDSPGLVFISGLSSDVVCINPTPEIPAGEYRYNAQTHQLIDVSSAPGVSTSD